MSKRTDILPTFFTKEGRLFAEFPDGTRYGVITRIKWLDGKPIQRRQYIRIDSDA